MREDSGAHEQIFNLAAVVTSSLHRKSAANHQARKAAIDSLPKSGKIAGYEK